MKTSYFAKYRGVNGVSIALKTPEWFKGKKCPELAPTQEMLDAYKRTGDVVAYTKAYKEQVLDKLEPASLFCTLGDDAVLLCWEGKGKFCHRRLVAGWFKLTLGAEVPEL